ncbi:MAG: hypothetical protein KDH88_10670 [Chromatiales bacterium]|nr:hypothetical protein [Chromatiales bacterium]
MTGKKLLERLGELLDLGAKRRKKKIDELEKLVDQIRKKEKAILAKCRKVGKGEKRDMLKKRYQILHAQRNKGRKALKKLEG